MAIKVYGSSDDLIEIDGEFSDEIGCYGTDDQDRGVLLACSDGTRLEVKYGKNDKGIWGIKALSEGSLFAGIEECVSEDADPYSDTAHMKDGVKWIRWYSPKSWPASNATPTPVEAIFTLIDAVDNDQGVEYAIANAKMSVDFGGVYGS